MKRYSAYLLLLTALSAVPACEKQGGGESLAPEQVPVQMAMSIGGGTPATKGDVTYIKELQDTPGFSGLAELRLLPFSAGDKVNTLRNSIPLLSIPAQTSNNAYYFGGTTVFTLPRQTASFLAYGKAMASGESTLSAVEFKHKNGSLIASGLDTDNAGNPPIPAGIGFSPEVMLPSGSTPADATGIANVLNSVVFGEPYTITAYYGDDNKSMVLSVPWDGSIGDANLRDCYQSITAGGALMPGSGTNVEAMLTNLFRALEGYTSINSTPYQMEKDGTIYTLKKGDGSVLTYGFLYNGVRDVVLERIHTLQRSAVLAISGTPSVISFTDNGVDPCLSTYPERLGLPSGAAVVRWTPSGYVVPLENGLDGIAPISRYCYPPAMYYYADTGIQTSDTEIESTLYENSSNNWNTILGSYKDGTVVTSTTRAVALKDPLHFGVGMLKATIVAESASLQDNDGLDYTLVDVSGSKFPLTGVIIGRQYPVKYDFSPNFTADSDQYYLYDNQISGIYLTTAQSAAFRTLSLETPAEKDTYFCLEFQNDSDVSFYGAEGRILPGHKFYLVGKLEAAPASGYTKVFSRDYCTTVNCRITSLKEAHSAVPDMGVPLLNLGVETIIDWTMSDPVTLILE